MIVSEKADLREKWELMNLVDKIIEVSNLSKAYGKVKAVNGIDFYVERGQLFAFLGPNGAGKSTTIDMICTFLKPDTGTVTINGYVLGKQDTEIRACIGAVFQDGLLDKLLTVHENLEVRGGFYGFKDKVLEDKIQLALNATDINDLQNRRYGKLSGGQRRRADISRALINMPKVLFLDEPTTGLDPQTRKAVWETIKFLQTEFNITIFLTTHYMEEAASADYVIVIDNGSIVAKGTPSQLKETYTSDKLYLKAVDMTAVMGILEKLKMGYTQEVDRLVVPIASSKDAIEILDLCKDSISSFEVIGSSMDDVFIEITGKEMRE